MSTGAAVSKVPEFRPAISPGACRLCGALGQTSVAVEGNDKRLVRCSKCAVVFLEPPPDEIDFTAEFEERHITSDDRLEKFFASKRDPVLAFAAAQIRRYKKCGAILDVGCAGGHFLANFFAPSDWLKFGVEPSRFAARRANENGIETYQGELKSVELPAGMFDVITALGVLLYFRDPRRDLAKLRRSLKQDGVLLIELPLAEAQLWRNTTKLSRFVAGKPRSLLGSNHLFYYNVASVTYLLQESGFAVKEVLTVPAMAQPTLRRTVLSRTYYFVSRTIWEISGRSTMLGPEFLVIASVA
jgi:SAM-dependent methyltransferase